MPEKPYAEAGIQSHLAPAHVGAVTLRSRDHRRLADFYADRIGLARLAETPEKISLGSGGVAYLHILAAPQAMPGRRSSSGLFHTAFLLPSRAALGQWFRRATAKGVELDGASDHDVSEAFYLTDPEGNGIEIYADRPAELWDRSAKAIRLTTERMDLAAVVAAGDAAAPGGDEVPAETRIGHIHLQVGDLPRAEAFYAPALGLDIVARYPGAAFYSWGGYHHHLATNVWASAGAAPRPAEATGLAEIEFAVREPGLFDTLRERIGPAAPDGRLTLADPWAIPLAFKLAA